MESELSETSGESSIIRAENGFEIILRDMLPGGGDRAREGELELLDGASGCCCEARGVDEEEHGASCGCLSCEVREDGTDLSASACACCCWCETRALDVLA